jgi:uncharacterized protein YjbI with pentapeptide repeats
MSPQLSYFKAVALEDYGIHMIKKLNFLQRKHLRRTRANKKRFSSKQTLLQRIPTWLFLMFIVLILAAIAVWLNQKDLLCGQNYAQLHCTDANSLMPVPMLAQAIVKVIFDNAESIAIVSAVALYFKEAPDRKTQSHYEAWQVIDRAVPTETSYARIKALEDLNNDGISLEEIDMPSADLAQISLKYANLTGATLTGAYLGLANLNGVKLAGAKLAGANLTDANLTDADLTDADLTDADLTVAQLAGAQLTGANLTNAKLAFANLTGAYLGLANLTSVDLSLANLTGANLTGVDFTGARLNNANFTQANLTGVDLTGANLTQANLSRANLAGASFCRTIMPNGQVNNDGCPTASTR